MTPTYHPTHKQLVERMARWVRNKHHCSVVMAELRTKVSETPDIIGFYGYGSSILIECKISRADFKADAHKPFRRYDGMAMGDLRYFAAPKGLLKPEELPDRWGLLEVSEYQVKETREATPQDSNKHHEVTLLMSAIRRLELSTAVFVQANPFEEPEEPKEPAFLPCDECRHFIPEQAGILDPKYNPCQRGHAMKFIMPDKIHSTSEEADAWGFHLPGCPDRVIATPELPTEQTTASVENQS